MAYSAASGLATVSGRLSAKSLSSPVLAYMLRHSVLSTRGLPTGTRGIFTIPHSIASVSGKSETVQGNSESVLASPLSMNLGVAERSCTPSSAPRGPPPACPSAIMRRMALYHRAAFLASLSLTPLTRALPGL